MSGITPAQPQTLFPYPGTPGSLAPAAAAAPVTSGNAYPGSLAQTQAASNAALTAALGTSANPGTVSAQPPLQLPGLSVTNTIFTLLTGQAAPSILASQGIGSLVSTQG